MHVEHWLAGLACWPVHTAQVKINTSGGRGQRLQVLVETYLKLVTHSRARLDIFLFIVQSKDGTRERDSHYHHHHHSSRIHQEEIVLCC